MDSQKRENLLNMALNATSEELAQSLILDTGFEEETQLWEVIVRYDTGILPLTEENREGLWEQLQRAGVLSERETEQRKGVRVVELLGGYGILTLTKPQILRLSNVPEITYIEMPKRLFFSVDKGRAASCISPLQSGVIGGERQKLLGRGVLVAILDSGECVIVLSTKIDFYFCSDCFSIIRILFFYYKDSASYSKDAISVSNAKRVWFSF